MHRLIAFLGSLCCVAAAQESSPAAPTYHFSRFAQGGGPVLDDGICKLLDGKGSKNQSNAMAWDLAEKGAFENTTLACKLRVLKGGDGGAFIFLNTAEYGARGPAPFVKSWVEPNLRGTFAVGIDVHNPKDEEWFSAWGNYRGMPQREVSLHWDGREIVKRMAPTEFRGEWADCTIMLHHVVGGAEVTVQLGESKVYDRFFVPALLPYESRFAIGAATRADAVTEFDVKDVRFSKSEAARPRRKPKHFEIFNHVLTDNKKQAFEAEVELPPATWEFGRIILTLQIHDAGPNWDEWDRNGEISIIDGDQKFGIVPFITSYRTECYWKVDVTHFRPWLSGTTKFEIRAGTNFYKNRGYMMSVDLDFYHGEPELEAFRVIPLWHGVAKYKSAENHFQDFFEDRGVRIGSSTRAARLFMTTTGHSQVGEFTPSKRTVVFQAGMGGEEHKFTNTLWKDDVYLNPNRPQFGTWKFSRAGWAPGDIVHPWWIDLTPHMVVANSALLRYVPEPYEFPEGSQKPTQEQINQASHVVRAYAILYRAPDEMMAAPSLQITGVEAKSNAAKAGIKRGDYLAEYNGMRIDSIADLRKAIQGVAPGTEKVKAAVYRGVKRIEVELAPGKMGVNLAEG